MDHLDPTAIPKLIDSHSRQVWRVLRRFGVAESDLEDVAQEVFLVVFRRLPEFDHRCQFQTWLFSICRRCAATYRRRSFRRHEQSVPQLPEESHPASQEEGMDRRRALELLDGILERLPIEQRETYVLFELERLPMSEVAAALECPVQTAYARLYAARRTIRAALSAHDRSVA